MSCVICHTKVILSDNWQKERKDAGAAGNYRVLILLSSVFTVKLHCEAVSGINAYGLITG